MGKETTEAEIDDGGNLGRRCSDLELGFVWVARVWGTEAAEHGGLPFIRHERPQCACSWILQQNRRRQ